MAKRFKEQLQIAPQSFDMGSEGAYSALSSIGQRLASFEDEMVQKRVQKAKLRGVEEARATELQKIGGVTQRPEKREVGFFGKYQDEAYNATILDSYVASVDTDMMNSVNAIYADHQDDVIGLNEALDGFWAGFKKAIDPAIVGEASLSFNAKSAQVRRSATINAKNKHTNIAISELKSSVAGYAREASSSNYNGDSLGSAESQMKLSAAIESLKKSDPVNKDHYDKLETDALRDIASQGYKKVIDEQFDKDPDLADKKIKDLKKYSPKGWEPDEWESFLNQRQNDVNYKKQKIKVDEKKAQLTDDQIVTNIISGEGTQKDKFWKIKSGGYKNENRHLATLERAYVPTETNEITYTQLSDDVGMLKKFIGKETGEQYLDRVQKARNDVTDKFNKGELSYKKYLELTDQVDEVATPLLAASEQTLQSGGVYGLIREIDWDNPDVIKRFDIFTGGNVAQRARMFGVWKPLSDSLAKNGIADENGKINPMLKNLPELEKLNEVLKTNDVNSNAARKEIARQVEAIETEKRKEMAKTITSAVIEKQTNGYGETGLLKKAKGKIITMTEEQFLKDKEITEEDISLTMKKNNVSRETVLRRMGYDG